MALPVLPAIPQPLPAGRITTSFVRVVLVALLALQLLETQT
jgi:hypothetical protein